MVEVTDISKNNNIRVDQNGASIQLLIGIGILGLARTLSFQGMGFSIAHSAGASTRHSRFMVLRFSMADTTAMATVIASVSSTNLMNLASNHAEDFTALSASMVAVASLVAEDFMAAEAEASAESTNSQASRLEDHVLSPLDISRFPVIVSSCGTREREDRSK